MAAMPAAIYDPATFLQPLASIFGHMPTENCNQWNARDLDEAFVQLHKHLVSGPSLEGAESLSGALTGAFNLFGGV
ncbi:hypothetical protein [Pseudaminobacter soli (ex Li et al. 2025)]|uniref:Uncharacterized protein n=1 Tax=Pseudaminobacter soli (ex Li et al. 2025) TaxID=1295366 RepID=A0A2P7S4D2_9HYPH|nr:hypothetical protein [Mesorhizobium soli]PSJ57330.1 hypothetical protein C7I85_22310 [Mesorhizobium soli]